MGRKVTKKEITEHFLLALKEIGEIVPKYNKTFKSWYF